jgi:hypothetical protein
LNRSPNIFFAPRFRLGWMLYIIGAVASLLGFLGRWSYENSLRDVQLTVDYEDTRSMADAYQISHASLLQELKKRGVSSVGVYNSTLGVLQGNGRLTVTPRDEAEALFPTVDWKQFPPSYRFLITAPPQSADLFQQAKVHLQEQAQSKLLPVRVVSLSAPAAPTPAEGAQATPTLVPAAREGMLISASQQLRGDAQLGFDPAAIKAIKAVGLVPTARVSNALNLNETRLRRLLDECKATGARVVIFSEDEVLGYDTLVPMVAREMRSRGLLFGNVEFTKQRGWPDFAERTDGQLVRVHSVGPDEAAKVKTHLLVDRYARAIKERNIRVAYIRLVRQFKGELDPETNKVAKNALQQNLDFVADVAREVKAAPAPLLRPALRLTQAQAFGEYPLEGSNSRWWRYASLFAAGLGALGATWLLLNLFFDLSVSAKTTVLVAGLAIVSVLSASSGFGARLIGLLAGVTVAPVAVLWGGLPRLWESIDDPSFGVNDTHVPVGEAFKRGFMILLATSGITLAGAMFIVAAFNHWQYISKTDEFFGEKATLLAPPLLIAIAFGGRVFPLRVLESGSAQARRLAWARLQDVLSQPFTFRVAVSGLLLALGGYIFIARTGNDSGMEISTLEWNFRSAMEQLFLTRPRTKEVFVGMPAMIFAVYFALKKQPLLALGAAVTATIGIADVVNTFCHFWTPLFYSLLRTVHAVWIGGLLGGLALWVWTKVERSLFGRMRPMSLGPAIPSAAPNDAPAPGTGGAVWESPAASKQAKR